jgi:hypothetical protein
MRAADDAAARAATRKSGCARRRRRQFWRMFRWMLLLASMLRMGEATLATAEPVPPPAVQVPAEPLSPRYRQVETGPTKTSIYVGTVTIALPPFQRVGNDYVTTYTTKVFPFFFYNENGRLWIEVSDAQLRQLERGERMAFKGHARNDAGDERRVEGYATATDATSGKIKVRVFATKSIELIFNTTYRFTGK